jgi:polar amino acid transport system substrate-binding protein
VSRWFVPRRRLSCSFPLLLAIAFLAVFCGSANSAGRPGAVNGPQSTREITVGIDTSGLPTGGTKGGKIIGMDSDVVDALQKVLPNLKLNKVRLTLANAVPAVKSGRVDVTFIGGWFDTPERRAQMNMVSYFTGGDWLLTKRGNPAGVGMGQGNCGKTIGVYADSSQSTGSVKAESTKFCTSKGKAAIRIVELPSITDGTLALRSGRIDGWMDVAAACAYFAKIHPQYQAVASDILPNLTFAFGVRKSELKLSYQLAGAIQKLQGSGVIPTIWKKWGFPPAVNIHRVTVNGRPIPRP